MIEKSAHISGVTSRDRICLEYYPCYSNTCKRFHCLFKTIALHCLFKTIARQILTDFTIVPYCKFVDWYMYNKYISQLSQMNQMHMNQMQMNQMHDESMTSNA